MTDMRFMAQGGGKAGVNEIKLGVPVPYLPTLVLTQMLGDRKAKEMIYTGDIYDQQWLKDAGFIDRFVQPAELLDEAVVYARKLGSSPQYAFDVTKAMRTRPIEEEYLKKQEEESIKFLECWFKDETRALLNEAKKKF
jgi:enoyl-CoA hydratase/carnithine racemase